MDTSVQMESIVRLKNIPIVERGLVNTKAIYQKLKVRICLDFV